MKSEILVIAEAILANTQVLRMLVEKLPAAVKEQVAAHVEQAAPAMTTPVTTVPAAHAPVTVPVATPAPVQKDVAVTVPAAPVQKDVAVTVPDCPIKDAKAMTDYVMSSYRALGAKGAEIQNVLQSIGCGAINEVRVDQYAALYAGIEALKA